MFPLIPYGAFTRYTPSIPEFYRNIYSSEEGLKKILLELSKLAAYANELADAINRLDGSDSQLELKIKRLQERIDALYSMLEDIALGGKTRNPMTGAYSFVYVALKQLYDTLRVHSMTWRQLANTGHTWAELASNGKTYIEVDMLANDIWGDGTEQIKYTEPSRIDVKTPGYMEV